MTNERSSLITIGGEQYEMILTTERQRLSLIAMVDWITSVTS